VNDLHHGCQIALLLKFARIDIDQAEEFVGIDQVEITGQCKIPGWNGIPFYERMAKFGIIPALGAIAQMPKEYLSQERDMSLHEPGVLGDIRLVFFQFLYLTHYFGEDICYRLVIAAPDPVKKRMAGFRIELYRCYSCPILAPVMLFFHEKVQLIEAIKYRPVLLQVIRERFAQPDECEAAFMFYFIAHEAAKLRDNRGKKKPPVFIGLGGLSQDWNPSWSFIGLDPMSFIRLLDCSKQSKGLLNKLINEKKGRRISFL